MIQIQEGIIELHTKDTSYVLRAERNKPLTNIYYGSRISIYNIDAVQNSMKLSNCMEFSFSASSLQQNMLHLKGLPAEFYQDFVYKGAIIRQGSMPPSGMPHGRSGNKTIQISVANGTGIEIELFYTVYFDANVITKRLKITNRIKEKIYITKIASQQLELLSANYSLHTLENTPTQGYEIKTTPLECNTEKTNNVSNNSVNTNPFFYLSKDNATEDTGAVYGFNLIYSGKQEYSIIVNQTKKVQIMQGISREDFNWKLKPGESFESPEAVLTFSNKGKNGMSQNMHYFVLHHVLPCKTGLGTSPVSITTNVDEKFRMSENKLIRMAQKGLKMGANMFVINDGWYGVRSTKADGYGDYRVNVKKIPSGLPIFANRLNGQKMSVGLFVAPELVSVNSNLYRTFPQWAIQGKETDVFYLNLASQEVREYIIKSIGNIIATSNIDMLYWNTEKPKLKPENESTMFVHEYILGLYMLLEGIRNIAPHIRIEGKFVNENRLNLGMLYYMDKLDIFENETIHLQNRIAIEYGYPQAAISSFLTGNRKNQDTVTESELALASFSFSGFSANTFMRNPLQTRDLTRFISFYKKNQSLFEQGKVYRIENSVGKIEGFTVAQENKKRAILISSSTNGTIKAKGLTPQALYKIEKLQFMSDELSIKKIFALSKLGKKERKLLQKTENEKESYIAYGNLLQEKGVTFKTPKMRKSTSQSTEATYSLYSVEMIDNKT